MRSFDIKLLTKGDLKEEDLKRIAKNLKCADSILQVPSSYFFRVPWINIIMDDYSNLDEFIIPVAKCIDKENSPDNIFVKSEFSTTIPGFNEKRKVSSKIEEKRLKKNIKNNSSISNITDRIARMKSNKGKRGHQEFYHYKGKLYEEIESTLFDRHPLESILYQKTSPNVKEIFRVDDIVLEKDEETGLYIGPIIGYKKEYADEVIANAFFEVLPNSINVIPEESLTEFTEVVDTLKEKFGLEKVNKNEKKKVKVLKKTS